MPKNIKIGTLKIGIILFGADECKIELFGNNNREWCWKKPSSLLDDRSITPTLKFGGGNLMVCWDVMTSKGIGYLVKIENGLDA